MTSRGHNLVFCTDKRPQKIIIWYSTQTNDITHYPMQKYDLKRSQSGIPHGQMTSKDHNPVFHTDKWHNPLSHAEIWPQEVTIWYSARTNGLKRSQSGISHRQTTSKDHNPVFHTDKWHNPLSHTEIWPQEVTIWCSAWTNDLKRS